jgi:hypothetical protein
VPHFILSVSSPAWIVGTLTFNKGLLWWWTNQTTTRYITCSLGAGIADGTSRDWWWFNCR